MISWIVVMIIVGILLFAAEVLLLPGITIAAIGSLLSFIGAVYFAFMYESTTTAWIVLSVVVLLIIILLIIFLRSSTWKKISLETQIPEALEVPKSNVGDYGKALTRLAPMGKVFINGETIEAKTMGEYIDEGSEVEVIGHDNMNIIVKLK